MYKEIGKKIQQFAIVGFVVEAIISVIVGLTFFLGSEEPIWFLLVLGGPLVAWVASWVLYGFGQLIINSDHSALDYNIRKIALALEKNSDSMIYYIMYNWVFVHSEEQKIFFAFCLTKPLSWVSYK